ncbi:hypothetical protein J7E73_04185 [Paenibacillus albidus]|nr:hypothetical protein [Paenibacillus albidus]
MKKVMLEISRFTLPIVCCSKPQWTKNAKQRFSNNGRIAALLTFYGYYID